MFHASNYCVKVHFITLFILLLCVASESLRRRGGAWSRKESLENTVLWDPVSLVSVTTHPPTPGPSLALKVWGRGLTGGGQYELL